MKAKKRIPFDFIFDELAGLPISVKPMFGCNAIYNGEKIVLIVREKPTYASDNGVWLATSPEHHESLRKIFPEMRSLALFGSEKETSWQNLPSNSSDFEESVLKACELVRKNDLRIGKVPARKRSRGKSKR